MTSPTVPDEHVFARAHELYDMDRNIEWEESVILDALLECEADGVSPSRRQRQRLEEMWEKYIG